MLKGIGIILVVIGHVNTKGFLVQWLYTFHMPLFFALSGYILYKFGKNIPLRKFLLKRTKSILWPFILFRLLLFIYWIVIESHFRDFDMGPIWFLIILYGMTYHEDVAAVKDSFKKMLENGVYKADLFSDL